MVDFKTIGIIMGVVAIVSIQYSLNIMIRLLREIIDLLHMIQMNKK
jgi:hypothetical protein